jgi:hypothetical protein
MHNDPQTLVIDSSILLSAIGQRPSRLRMSLEHDRNLASLDIDPFKARATLLAALTTHTLLIPRAVIRQMESLLRSPSLSEKNCAHIRSLIEVLEPYSINALASRQDLFQQRNALECLEASAKFHTANLGAKDSASHPVCQAWSRLAPHLPAARHNIENLLGKPHISETEQDALLCFADLRECELAANDQEQPLEFSQLDPLIRKILNDFLDSRPNAREHFAFLAPEALEKEPLHIQAAYLNWLAETLRPFLFPEFEVILLARDCNSAILTLSPDFHILRKFLPILKKLPYPLSTLDGFQLQPTPEPEPQEPDPINFL